MQSTRGVHKAVPRTVVGAISSRGLWILLALCIGPGTAASVDDRAQEKSKLPQDHLPTALYDSPVPFGLGPNPKFDRIERRSFDLGRKLFFDSILSQDLSLSCASCHQPDHGFSVAEALPAGIKGKPVERHPPSIINRAWGTLQSWDGRAGSLEEQMLLPIENEREMGLPLTEAMARLRASDEYSAAFTAIYPQGVTKKNLAHALASFVGRLTSGGSPVDQFLAGTASELSVEAKAGMWVFDSKGKCWQCHSGRNYSDELFHNTGVGVVDGVPEIGRSKVTGKPNHRGAFRTPTLRGLTVSAPYMHDGSVKTLRDVVEFYRDGGHSNPHLDRRIEPIPMTDEEAEALVAFLEALSAQPSQLKLESQPKPTLNHPAGSTSPPRDSQPIQQLETESTQEGVTP